MDAQLKRGLIDICVLAAIRNEDSYGYRIIKIIKPYIEISESTLCSRFTRWSITDGCASTTTSTKRESNALTPFRRNGRRSPLSITLSQRRQVMNKTAFMNDLSDKLDRLSEDDRKEYLEFFSEIIDDKIEEDGSNEAAAVEAMDSTENIADAINRQIPVEPGDAEYVENHSVIDCTNRYRMDDGRYNFTIKLPEDVSLRDVIIEITSDYSGTRQSCTNLFYLTDGENAEFQIRLENAYGGFNYYELTTDRFADTGMGVRLYLTYKDKNYMATDISNHSLVKGSGYWLGAY